MYLGLSYATNVAIIYIFYVQEKYFLVTIHNKIFKSYKAACLINNKAIKNSHLSLTTTPRFYVKRYVEKNQDGAQGVFGSRKSKYIEKPSEYGDDLGIFSRLRSKVSKLFKEDYTLDLDTAMAAFKESVREPAIRETKNLIKLFTNPVQFSQKLSNFVSNININNNFRFIPNGNYNTLQNFWFNNMQPRVNNIKSLTLEKSGVNIPEGLKQSYGLSRKSIESVVEHGLQDSVFFRTSFNGFTNTTRSAIETILSFYDGTNGSYALGVLSITCVTVAAFKLGNPFSKNVLNIIDLSQQHIKGMTGTPANIIFVRCKNFVENFDLFSLGVTSCEQPTKAQLQDGSNIFLKPLVEYVCDSTRSNIITDMINAFLDRSLDHLCPSPSVTGGELFIPSSAPRICVDNMYHIVKLTSDNASFTAVSEHYTSATIEFQILPVVDTLTAAILSAF